MNGRHILAFAVAGSLALTALATGGCAARTRPASAQPATLPTARPLATDIPPETATAAYWLAQGPAVSVTSPNYDDLLQECDHVLRQRRFDLDRLDYREGLLVSKPLVSKQFWEFWRDDVVTCQQVMASSVATYRRIVQWQVHPTEGGAFSAVPRVVVERISSTPQRITMTANARASIITTEAQIGLRASRLEQVPATDWYAVSRDKPLELALANDLLARMQKHPSGATLQRIQPTDGK